MIEEYDNYYGAILSAAGIPSHHLALQEGITSLYSACNRGDMETVKLLLEYGAQVNQANNVS